LDELSIILAGMKSRVGKIIHPWSWNEEQGWMNYLYIKLG
jgi:hypothetical protein